MTDDREPDQRTRAELEAIVFGRHDAVSDAEHAAAAQELARLLKEERALEPIAEAEPQLAPSTGASPRQPAIDDRVDDTGRASWRRRVLLAALAVGAVVAVAVAVRVLVFGWQPFPPSDPLAIFDRPQTEQELLYATRLGYPDASLDSFRFVESDDGFDVYVYEMLPHEQNPVQDTFYCAILDDGQNVTRLGCTSADAFGLIPFGGRTSDGGRWTETAWDPHNGVSVTTGTNPPIPPPLSVFDEEQDDADLNALAYLPDIPSSQQDSVRFLGDSAGYYVAAYRDADDAVCLAIYQGGTTVVTSESVCVTEGQFEETGIQLIYPAAAPEISVTWGPAGVAFSGR